MRRKIDEGWPLFFLRSCKGIGKVLALAVFFLMGYFYRQVEAYDHTRYRYNVRVIERLSPQQYWMQNPDGDRWMAKFCTDSPVDLDPGMTLEYLVYEERGRCKSLSDAAPNVGFKVVRDKTTRKFIDFRIEESHYARP